MCVCVSEHRGCFHFNSVFSGTAAFSVIIVETAKLWVHQGNTRNSSREKYVKQVATILISSGLILIGNSLFGRFLLAMFLMEPRNSDDSDRKWCPKAPR